MKTNNSTEEKYYELAEKVNAADYDFDADMIQAEVKAAINAWETTGRPIINDTNSVVLSPYCSKDGNLSFVAYCFEAGKDLMATYKKAAEEMPEVTGCDMSEMLGEDAETPFDEVSDDECVFGTYRVHTNIRFEHSLK